MANSVVSAFNEFLKETVNLDSKKTKDARKSKDWLIGKIHSFPDNDTEFPRLYTDVDIHYGSFARRTKIRPLDDIDLMIGIAADGTTYYEYGDTIKMTVPESAKNLHKLCNDYTDTLNSIKVINKFIKSLKEVSQYAKSDIKRNQEAAVLELSYEWNFDIVPCFFTKPTYDGRTFYIIPDGNGNWKKTDPRIDQERVTNINQRHEGNALNLIRVLKYWNKRKTMPSAPSYMFETLILDFLDGATGTASKYVDIDLPTMFNHISTAIYFPVYDPKNIQGDINSLTQEEKQKIANRASLDYQKAKTAREYEHEKKHKESINKWIEVFGDDFPKYTE